MTIKTVPIQTPKLLKPEVTLFAYTNRPLSAIVLAIEVWHNQLPTQKKLSISAPRDKNSFWDILKNPREMEKRIRWLYKQPHQTPLEYLQMTFVIKNVSRAFQQQLTRHRLASYSIQSLRIVDVGSFATEGRYHMPLTVEAPEAYHRQMIAAQEAYKDAIKNGESVEDARGLLPLNIHSPITMNISFRALIGLMKQRLCVAAQEEWREVVGQIREAMIEVNPVFGEPLDCMCSRYKVGQGVCKTTHEPVTSRS